MDNIALQNLYRGIKKGNNGDFRTFFDYYFPRLLYYARRFVDKESGEDLVQDVFVYVWENKDKLDMENASFISFLYETVYNKAINVLTRRKMMGEKHAQIEINLKALHYFSPYSNPVFEKLIHLEQYEALEQAIERLPEKGRLCIKMSYLQGLKTGDIAKALHISPRTVEAHLYNSIKTLRKMFRNEDAGFLIFICAYFSQGVL